MQQFWNWPSIEVPEYHFHFLIHTFNLLLLNFGMAQGTGGRITILAKADISLYKMLQNYREMLTVSKVTSSIQILWLLRAHTPSFIKIQCKISDLQAFLWSPFLVGA